MSATVRRGFQLSDDIQYMPRVGPHRAVFLRKLGIRSVGDLLEHFPARHERHESRTIENLEEGIVATVVGEIGAVRKAFGRRGATVSTSLLDNTGRCRLSWFNAGWMGDRLSRGMIVRATGKVTEYRDQAQLVNPTVVVLQGDECASDMGEPDRFEAVYPASAAVSSRSIGKLIAEHLDGMISLVEEWHPPAFLQERGLCGRAWAMTQMHRPAEEDHMEQARRRLAYDELLLLQLATSLARVHRRERLTARPLKCSEEIDRRIRLRFPFPLTSAQNRAVAEIVSDLVRPRPMNRMLQGDVGCGKTVVALYAGLTAVANGVQAAIMAPTELLAEQHAASIERYLDGSRVRHALLRGGMAAKERAALLGRIAGGELDIVVGTHAMIQKDVRFERLGLVVVDEQHRFGVRQRASIRSKGPAPHYLVMTATPIPRTLAMTVFGDLDVTTIDELPPGRSAIDTAVVPPGQVDAAWARVRNRLAHGEQAFVVYPIIDESDKLDVRAATTEFERLRTTVFADHRVGLLHGRMRGPERDAVMAAFIGGTLDVLVATTVIEVGIDVPNATCMVIEHAERYGLAQLHQLRGRVGRGSASGYCFLMTGSDDAATSRRLGVLARTTDGFVIAEEDLRLRGPGEMLGTRQHGLPTLHVADLVNDGELLRLAQGDAGRLLRDDRELRRPDRGSLRRALLAKYGEVLGFLDVG